MSFYIDDNSKNLLNSVVAPNGPFKSHSEAVRNAINKTYGGTKIEFPGRTKSE